MKEHLVKLLFEEYKQIYLVEELAKKGVDLSEVAVENHEIVLDLIGFPKDNSKEYHSSLPGLMEKEIDENYFSRDWLYQKFYDIVIAIENKQTIEVTNNGLKLIEKIDETAAIKKLSKYVDWLYDEYFILRLNQ